MIKYKRTGSHNWNDNSAWSSSSGGSPDTVAPVAGDDVKLDANSGNLVMNVAGFCRSFNTTGYTGVISGTALLTIGDATAGDGNIALKLVSGMTISAVPFTFLSSSTTQQEIDFANKVTGAITIGSTSVGGNYLISNPNTTSSAFTHVRGTVDYNELTYSWGRFDSSNTNTRNLILDNVTITLTLANMTVWIINNNTGLTLSATGSRIIMNAAGATFTIPSSTSQVYDTLEFTGSGNATIQGNTVNHLIRTGTNSKNDGMIIGSGLNVGTLELNSNSEINRLLIQSSVLGTQRTINADTVVVSHTVDFQDINGTGDADWTVAGTGATHLGDCNGNSGITFTPSALQTWISATGGVTSDITKWSGRIPLPQDDISFNNAFSASQGVTCDMPRVGRNIDWTGATGTPSWTLSVGYTIYGGIKLITGMNISGGGNGVLNGRGDTFDLFLAGKTMAGSMIVNAIGGTYRQLDGYRQSANFTLVYGGWDNQRGYSFLAQTFNSSNGNVRSLLMGKAEITLTTTSNTTFFTVTNTTNLTLDMDEATIILSTATSNARTIALGAGQIYGELRYNVASTGTLIILNASRIKRLNINNGARTIQFNSFTTFQIDKFDVRGAPSALITITVNAGGTFNLAKLGDGVIGSDYLNVANCNCTTPNKFYAGTHSTDGGGNTNVIFDSFKSPLPTIQ